MKRHAVAAALFAVFGFPAAAHDFGFAGILSASNMEELPELTLSSGKPVSQGPLVLKSGRGYELTIVSDGTDELGLEGANFFRAIWINEIVVNDLEIRPYGIQSVEFDDAGRMEIEFIAIKPGRYDLRIPGSTGESQRVEITIQ
jgi:hypothetical protein